MRLGSSAVTMVGHCRFLLTEEKKAEMEEGGGTKESTKVMRKTIGANFQQYVEERGRRGGVATPGRRPAGGLRRAAWGSPGEWGRSPPWTTPGWWVTTPGTSSGRLRCAHVVLQKHRAPVLCNTLAL